MIGNHQGYAILTYSKQGLDNYLLNTYLHTTCTIFYIVYNYFLNFF